MVNSTSSSTREPSGKTAASKKSAKGRKLAASRNRHTTRASAETLPGQVYRRGREVVSGVYQSGVDLGRGLPKLPRTLKLRERGQTVYEMVEDRPLVFGAIGLGVGMVLAALLPSMSNLHWSRTEQ